MNIEFTERGIIIEYDESSSDTEQRWLNEIKDFASQMHVPIEFAWMTLRNIS